MKVRTFDTESRVARLELSRRNLLTLLAKLDHNLEVLARAEEEDQPIPLAELSQATIGSPLLNADGTSPGTIWVTAVEDVVHYADRDPGPMLDNATGKMV